MTPFQTLANAIVLTLEHIASKDQHTIMNLAQTEHFMMMTLSVEPVAHKGMQYVVNLLSVDREMMVSSIAKHLEGFTPNQMQRVKGWVIGRGSREALALLAAEAPAPKLADLGVTTLVLPEHVKVRVVELNFQLESSVAEAIMLRDSEVATTVTKTCQLYEFLGGLGVKASYIALREGQQALVLTIEPAKVTPAFLSKVERVYRGYAAGLPIGDINWIIQEAT